MKEKQKCPTDIGVIVGRFQTNELHFGHNELINHILSKHGKVIIVLGISNLLNTIENPLNASDRRQMIQTAFPEIEVLYLKDCRSDVTWSKNLDKLISENINPNQTVSLYGSRNSFISTYSGSYETIELEPSTKISATEIRRKVCNNYRSSVDYRAGIIAATAQRYPTVYTTVDAAIFSWNNDKILLGRKPDENKLRFIGGFTDVNSDSLEANVRREVREEAGIIITDPIYVSSVLVDDWRYRNERDKILTTIFVCKYQSGKIVADDDLFSVSWIDSKELLNNPEKFLMEEHIPVAVKVKEYLIKHADFIKGQF